MNGVGGLEVEIGAKVGGLFNNVRRHLQYLNLRCDEKGIVPGQQTCIRVTERLDTALRRVNRDVRRKRPDARSGKGRRTIGSRATEFPSIRRMTMFVSA